MTSNHTFSNTKVTFEEYLKTLQQSMIDQKIVAWGANMGAGIDALSNINTPEQRQLLIDVSVLVDQNMIEPHTRKNDLFHKLPVFTTIARLIANHYDDIKELSRKQLAALSVFSCVVNEEYLDKHLILFANKELLQSVIDKSIEWREQTSILGIVEDRYFDLGIDKKDEVELNNFRNEMTSFINSSSKEEILALQKPMEVVWEEFANSGIRI